MESQKTMTNSKNEIDSMVEEVTCVLRNHLINLVKTNHDMSETMDILHKLPVIKNLQLENTNLKKKIVGLNSEIAVLKSDLFSSQINNSSSKAHLQLEVSEIKKITLNKPFIMGSVESEEDNILLQMPSQNNDLRYLTALDEILDKNDEPIIVKKKDIMETNKSDAISTIVEEQPKLVKNSGEINLATSNGGSLDETDEEDVEDNEKVVDKDVETGDEEDDEEADEDDEEADEDGEEADEDGEEADEDGEEADENIEDPILSQFSSELSSVESFSDSSTNEISKVDEPSPEPDIKKRRAEEDETKNLANSSKRPKTCSSKQTTLNAWLVKKGR